MHRWTKAHCGIDTACCAPEQVGQIPARLLLVMLDLRWHGPLHLHRVPVLLRHHFEQHALLLRRHDIICSAAKCSFVKLSRAETYTNIARVQVALRQTLQQHALLPLRHNFIWTRVER